MTADPTIINYTSLAFSDILTDLITYITNNSTFSDQNKQGSNLNLLAKINSYITTLLSYNLNSGIGETYLDTAQLRTNVLKLVKTLGYTPVRTQSAQVYVNLTAITASPNFTSAARPG